jgi:hypothetical protein
MQARRSSHNRTTHASGGDVLFRTFEGNVKYQLRLEQHLALAAIHLNWQLGQPARVLSAHGY